MPGKNVKYWWLVFFGVNALIAVLISTLFSQSESRANPPEAALRSFEPQISEPFNPNLDTAPTLDPPGASAIPEKTVTPKPKPRPLPKYNLSPIISSTHQVSWSIMDMKTGLFAGSVNWDKPSYLMSMIKPWIAADYFNSHPNPSDKILAQLESMIVDSNDQVAYQYFGGQKSWDRLIKTCGLTDLVVRNWSWSLTEMSARDAVRYGYCIYSGMATTDAWTAWIVDKMRHVRGDGDFGPRELFPDRTVVATKNGWYNYQGKWYVNCLAITDDWAISVLQVWPYDGGDLKYGINLANPTCKSVAGQLLRLTVL